MSKVICFKRSDGGCTIRVPIADARSPDESEADFLDRVARKPLRKHTAVSSRVVDTQDLPDREFRDAWEDDGSDIKVNLTKAKAVQRDRIQTAKMNKAFELLIREAAGENVASEKASLNAIDPDAITSAPRSVNALKAAWPAALKKP